MKKGKKKISPAFMNLIFERDKNIITIKIHNILDAQFSIKENKTEKNR